MAIKRQFDYNRKTDTIYGVSANGNAAKQAMVLMTRGILGKWKQPIGYFFSSSSMLSEEIADTIRGAIHHLQAIGLTVQAIVCDQATTNVRALHLLGATLDPQGGGGMTPTVWRQKG
ncbi:hypothetical protein PBY51_022848 [Eleginops maclovinus]|uniref:Transposable element P transposase-like RNase H domain-containing protein n=1 Tax=Eleginops maclovinus TaxID=56733 RepID=A0AAN7XI04_ELEMC|nr:hypothetical protein PBY51_022848 [Eleginops maclovinus]